MTARVLAETAGMPWGEVLKLRRIGGSDAPVIAGVSPWKGPVELWMERTSRVAPPDESEAMHFGTLLEPIVADEFARRNGLRVQRRNAVLLHPEHDFATCNLDRLVRTDDGWIPLQVKTSGWGHDWADDECPVHVTVQVQHELAITGAPFEFVAVLIGGNRYRDYVIQRDDALIDDLLAAEGEFWRHVQDQTMPPVDGRESTRTALAQLHERLDAIPVDLPHEALDLRDAYWQAHASMEAAADRKRLFGSELARMLLDAGGQVGLVDGETVVSWKRPVPKTPRFDGAAHRTLAPECHEAFLALPDPDSLAPTLKVRKAKAPKDAA